MTQSDNKSVITYQSLVGKIVKTNKFLRDSYNGFVLEGTTLKLKKLIKPTIYNSGRVLFECEDLNGQVFGPIEFSDFQVCE